MKTVYSRFSRPDLSIQLRYLICTMMLVLAASFVHTIMAQGCVVTCPPMEPPVPISLSQECTDTITAEQVGLFAPNCNGPFEVDIMDPAGGSLGNVITADMIGETFMVILTSENDGGQGCMTAITVVDKYPPIVSCPADTIVPCTTILDSLPKLTQDDVLDCFDVDISHLDELVSGGECDSNIISKFRRTYFVIDENNNVFTCTQMISLEKIPLESFEGPADLKGDDALPCFPEPDLSPENTGFPTVNGGPIVQGNICNLLSGFSDQTVPICSGSYKIIRTWTIMDWCTNAMTETHQIIEVKDMTGPDVTAPDDFTVSAGPGCIADVLFPPAALDEDCSEIEDVRIQGPFGTIESNGALVPGLPAGVHQIIYIATNDCDRVGRDTLILTISDFSAPSAVCHGEVAVPLDDNGMSIVPAEAFDAGSYDNCGDVYFKVKRMNVPPYSCTTADNPFYRFDDEVKFCCEDLAEDPLMVILRVYDVEPIPGPVSDSYLSGNFTECMVMVEIQDKIGPSITCPPNITVSCKFPFDPNNLYVFGKVVTDPEDVEDIVIDDPEQPGYIGPVVVGQDGLATDNCETAVVEEVSMVMDSTCGTGTIFRTFIASDAAGRSASCDQTIVIENFNPFDSLDITWPLDFFDDGPCDISALDPENLPDPFGFPQIVEDECDLVGVDYEDDVFDLSGDSEACFKILRTWTVINWCDFDHQDPSNSIFEYTQIIKILNNEAPVITSDPEDIQMCTDINDCGPGLVTLAAAATDDCTADETLTWKISIDADNNGSFDFNLTPNPGSSVSEDVLLPFGFHRVVYAVQDFCGNTTTTEQFVDMINCTGPSAKCQSITSTLMAVDLDNDGQTDWGSVTIWASDLDAGSDHPCGLQVSVAFSEDPNDTNITFDCDDIGPNEVELYVIDENGLVDFCTVTVTIQDNSNVCPTDPLNSGVISGAIASTTSSSMNDVMVELKNTALQPAYTADGTYEFPPMPLGGTYEVNPVSADDFTNGVTTIDLIRIQKHLLGIQEFSSPYAYIAADANKSGNVTAVDILELKKLILGVYSELPNNTSWRFIDAAYAFIDESNPLNEDFPESYMIDPFQSDMTNVDFTGIKIGDLNESAQLFDGGNTGQTNLAVEEVIIAIEEVQGESSPTGYRTVLVSVPQLEAVEGLQFTLSWDSDLVDVVDVLSVEKTNPNQWNAERLDDGLLSFSWTVHESGPVFSDDILQLVIRASDGIDVDQAFQLSSDLTEGEALKTTGEVAIPRLQSDARHTNGGSAGVELYQNIPNPFSGTSLIPFEIEDAGSIRLTITDAFGRVVYTAEKDAIAGYNEIEVSAKEIQARGLLLYTIETGTTRLTKRMIIVGE